MKFTIQLRYQIKLTYSLSKFSPADSTKTTILFSLMSHWTSRMKGEMTAVSLAFLITSTIRGGLDHVSRWEAGFWIVLYVDNCEIFVLLYSMTVTSLSYLFITVD